MDDIEAVAKATPDKPAIIVGETGAAISYYALAARAARAAHLFRGRGLKAGDTLALCLPNSADFLVAAWGASRAGLTVVPISTKLTASEICFIVKDSGSCLLVASSAIGAAFASLPQEVGDTPLLSDWEAELATQPATPFPDGPLGGEMLYSSGTTGRPKGIRHRNPAGASSGLGASTLSMFDRLGIGANDILHSPAPLYHSAPFRWTVAMLRRGGTVVLSERFDAAGSLALIERHGVTISQWVPTHFVRLLKLPDDVRRSRNTASLRLAVHAAAPCSIAVKRAMIDWLGPILLEYFGSTEQAGLTLIDSADWLAHPGSVGRAFAGRLHICDDAGEPLTPGEVGILYVEGGVPFDYHGDPARTAASRNRHGWTTVGDVGRLDADGWLYLADRKDFMIISGGVNVYPQEIEDLLLGHPDVADVAVIGTPHDDLGEQVTAVVQPSDPRRAGVLLANELRTWLRERLSPIKVPRRIEFEAELPRLPTGKLQKFKLRETYAKTVTG